MNQESMFTLAVADTSNTNTKEATKKNKKKNKKAEKTTGSSDSTATATTTATATAITDNTADQNLNLNNTTTKPTKDSDTVVVDTINELDLQETQGSTVSLEDAAATFNVNNGTWDIFLAGFFVVGALLYGVSLGKDRIISMMVSIYMALAIVATLPDFVLNIKINSNFTLQITAFIAVFLLLFFMLSRQAVWNSLSPSSDGKWWQVLLFSFLHVGLLVAVTMSFLPAEVLAKFSDFVVYAFTDQWTYFGWIVAPVLAMIFVGRSNSDD